jgi:hypothetical protein
MALTLKHFDTKSGKNLDIEENVENSLAEYFFPDTEFDVGTIHTWSSPEDLEKEHEGKKIQFAAQGRGYYASDDVRYEVFNNDSEALIRSKLLFTPCAPTELKKQGIEGFQELTNVRILVVDEKTGSNGGMMPPDVAKKLVGDCHGKVTPDLAEKLTGRRDTPFQYRMGVKPQEENPDGYQVRKGTLAPANLDNLAEPFIRSGKTASGQLITKTGYDMILPMSGVYGTGAKSLQPGEYCLRVGVGVKSLATYRDHSLGTQVLVHYPKAVQAEILPQLKEQAEHLREIASDPRAMARHYIEKYEKRQAFLARELNQKQNAGVAPEELENLAQLDDLFQSTIGDAFGDGEPSPDEEFGDDSEERQQKGEDFLYRILKADEEHGHLLEHSAVVSALERFVRQERMDMATGRAVKFTSGLAQPSEGLEKDKEICVPNISDGAKVAVYRSPLINSNGVLVLTNKHLPEYKNLKGIVAIHPDTAAEHLQGDFDGDNLAVCQVIDLKEELDKLAEEDAVLTRVAAQLLAQKDPVTAYVVNEGLDFVSQKHPALLEPLPEQVSEQTLERAQSIVADWNDKYPVFCSEIQEALLPENRYPDVVKNKKVPYEGLTFAEMTMAVQDDKIGLIANQLQAAIVQRWESSLMPEDERALYVSKIADKYEELLAKHADPEQDFALPNTPENPLLQKIQAFVADFPPSGEPLTAETVEQKLEAFRTIQGDVIAEYGNQLQRAVDTFKNSLQPEKEKLAYCDALTSFQEVAWIRDKKNQKVYSNGNEMRSTNYSPVDLMVRQSNAYYREDTIEKRPTHQFKALFEENFTQEQFERAKEIRDTYNQFIDRAKHFEKRLEKDEGPVLAASDPKTGARIEITNVLGSKHPEVFSTKPKDLYLMESRNPKDPPGTLLAVARVEGQFKPDGKPLNRVLGTIDAQSVADYNLEPKQSIKKAQIEIEPPPTKNQVKAVYKQANDYLRQVNQETPDSEKPAMAAALWHACHSVADKENQAGMYRRATVAFKAFPEQLSDRLKDLQFTTLAVVGIHKQTNEHSGRNWEGQNVEVEIGIETREGNANQGKPVIFVEGKQLGPFQQESPRLPIGTKATATVIPFNPATIELTTKGGNKLVIDKIRHFDFADRQFNGEKRHIKISFAPDPDPQKKRNIPVATLDDKILGRIEYKSGMKLKERGYLQEGVVLPDVSLQSISTAAIVKIDPESVRYPEHWVKQGNVARDENTAKVASTQQQDVVSTQPLQQPEPSPAIDNPSVDKTVELQMKHPTEFARGDRFYDSDSRLLEVVEPTDIKTVWAAQIYGDNPKDIDVKLTVKEVGGSSCFVFETENSVIQVQPSGETLNYPSLSETLDKWRQAAVDSEKPDAYLQRIDEVTAEVYQTRNLPSDRALKAIVRDLNDPELASSVGIEPPSPPIVQQPESTPHVQDGSIPSSNPLKNLQPINSVVAAHMKKDVAMAEVATQFIGKSAAPLTTPSSTRNYESSWGSRANTGNYTSTDVVMVSGSGPWRGVTNQQIEATFQQHYVPLLEKAVAAKATVVVGDAAGTDKLVQDYLSQQGYTLEPDKAGFIRCSSVELARDKEPTPERQGEQQTPQAGNSKVAAPINIYSGSNSSLGAALTNPTELSKLKGNVQNSYPVSFKDNPFRPKDTSGAEKYFQDKPAGERFVSAEDAYQHFKKTTPVEQRQQLMTEIIAAKLEQHPKLTQAIENQGGTTWLETCEHTTAAHGYWEGKGRNSPFIAALIDAYEQVRDKQLASCSVSQEEVATAKPENIVPAVQIRDREAAPASPLDKYAAFLDSPSTSATKEEVSLQVGQQEPTALPREDVAPAVRTNPREADATSPLDKYAAFLDLSTQTPQQVVSNDSHSSSLDSRVGDDRVKSLLSPDEAKLVKAALTSLDAHPGNADAQVKVGTIHDKYAVTFDSSSSTLRIFDAVGSRGLVYEASKNEPATVNHLGEEDFQAAQGQERSPLENRLIASAMSAISANSSHPELTVQVATLADKYVVSFDKESETLQIVDPTGERGVLYMTQMDKEAQINNFEPAEIQALPRFERPVWEDAMLKQAISSLNSNPANTPDKKIKVATLSTPSGSYGICHDKETDTIQLFDAKDGQRGIVYQAGRGQPAKISNFREDEKTAFLTQNLEQSVSEQKVKAKASAELGV